jgi:hypothetical protein
MSKCSTATELYCSPTKNELCFDNDTYSFTFNPKFSTLNTKKSVDIYLYHADDGTLAQKLPSRPNNGQYAFTLDGVGSSLVSGVNVDF